MEEEDRAIGRLEAGTERLWKSVEILSKKIDEHCEKCLMRKAVIAVIALVSLSVIGALISLVIMKGPIK